MNAEQFVFDPACEPHSGSHDDPQDLVQFLKKCSSSPEPLVDFIPTCYSGSHAEHEGATVAPARLALRCPLFEDSDICGKIQDT
jgi:hypothetical protein